jgi:hypothetical protein
LRQSARQIIYDHTKITFNFMDDMSQYRRAAFLAGDTTKRLEREGHSAEEARRMVINLINAEEFAVMTGRHSFDEARFLERLRQLPD